MALWIERDAAPAVVAATAEVGRVEQRGTGRVEFGHERVAVGVRPEAGSCGSRVNIAWLCLRIDMVTPLLSAEIRQSVPTDSPTIPG